MEKKQLLMQPASMHTSLWKNVIQPYKKSKPSKRIEIKTITSEKEPTIKVYEEPMLPILQKEKMVVQVTYPYASSDVLILDARYAELGQKIKEYITGLEK